MEDIKLEAGKEQEFITALKTFITAEINKQAAGKATPQEVSDNITKALKEYKINLADSEDFTRLKTALDDIGVQLKSFTEKGGDKPKTVKEQITEQLTTRKDEWDAFKQRKNKEFVLTVSKAAATMLYATHGNDSGRIEYIPGITEIAQQQPSIIQFCNSGSTGSLSLVYIQKINKEGNAAVTAAGTIAPLIDFEIDAVTSTAVDVPGRIEIHENMLNDIDFLTQSVEYELRYEVDKAADDAVLSTITGAASAFTQTGIEVVNPNTLDCIRAAATQIEATGFGRATLVCMNPVDFMNMVSSKDNNANYVMLPIITFNGTQIDNLTVYKTTQVAAGNLLVADGSKLHVYEYGSYEAAMGYQNDDFPQWIVTIRGRRRLHKFVKSNEAGSVVYDAIADIQTAITKA